MLRWMFWEQYNHEPNVATLRFWTGWIGLDNLNEIQRAQLDSKRSQGVAALKLMDEHLAVREWFVGGGITLADIALYAYTHVCEEGGFRLADYPNVQRWLANVVAEPGYVEIDA
jgi:glutathione S-transferase